MPFWISSIKSMQVVLCHKGINSHAQIQLQSCKKLRIFFKNLSMPGRRLTISSRTSCKVKQSYTYLDLLKDNKQTRKVLFNHLDI